MEPAALPPTERATHYHSLRVHLEIMRVTRLDIDCGLDPRNWGWQTVDGVLRPIKTDLPPAPEFLLTVISCSCKTTSRNTWGTMMCNCRKSGLKCVTACGDCRGNSCQNADENDVSHEYADEEYPNLFENLFDIWNHWQCSLLVDIWCSRLLILQYFSPFFFIRILSSAMMDK